MPPQPPQFLDRGGYDLHWVEDYFLESFRSAANNDTKADESERKRTPVFFVENNQFIVGNVGK